MDKEMMRALQQDAAMLEAMGAGEQPLAFIGPASVMRLTNAELDLWEVLDVNGNVLASGVDMEEADKMLCST